MKGLPPPDPLLKQEGETTGTDESPLLDKEGVGGGRQLTGIVETADGAARIHNKSDLKSRRKALRNEATPAERQLWRTLQHSQLHGYKFRRQHSVGYYILDFYCPSERLAVELDGDSHFSDEAIEYDRERTAFLNSLNIRVLRFLNTDVFTNLESVCERIIEEIRIPSLPPLDFKSSPP
jgi:very-short-patch-repair endonuclease